MPPENLGPRLRRLCCSVPIGTPVRLKRHISVVLLGGEVVALWKFDSSLSRRSRGCIAAAVVLLVSACGHNKPERKTASEIYNEFLNSEGLIVEDAGRYIRRVHLQVTSDVVPHGVYTPRAISSYFGGVRELCDEASAVLDSIARGETGAFEVRGDFDPFAKPPRQLTYWEQERNETGSSRPSHTHQNPLLALGSLRLDCDMPLQALEEDYDTSLPKSNYSEEQLDLWGLRYVVEVSESKTQRDRRRSVEQPDSSLVDRYLAGDEALAAKARRLALLASVYFEDEDIPDLVRVLPIRHQQDPDGPLALPSEMLRFAEATYKSIWDSISSSYTKPFPYPQLHTVERSFLIGVGSQDAGLGRSAFRHAFNARVSIDGDHIYISPLQLKAPFLFCHRPIYQFLESRMRFGEDLRRENAGWQSISDVDAEALGKAHKSYDDSYRHCVRQQLEFVVSHELAHVIWATQVAPGDEHEMYADCLAFLRTRQNAAATDEFFKLLAYNAETSEQKRLMTLRSNNLRQLKESLRKQADAPTSTDKMVSWCERELTTRKPSGPQ